MPLYGSVFYEAIPSPLGQSPSLLMQPGWLGPFPGRDGGHLEGRGALFFPLSSYLEVLFVFFCSVFHTFNKNR